MSLLLWLSSTHSYFITEYKNANHCLFLKVERNDCDLNPDFFFLPAYLLPIFCPPISLLNNLSQHQCWLSIPIFLFLLRTIRQLSELHSILCCCTFNPSVYMQVISLSTIWERQPVFGILILYYYSNIEAIINHSTSTNKRNKRNCTDGGGGSILRNKNIHNNIALLSKLVALKTAACWIHAASCGVRRQAF